MKVHGPSWLSNIGHSYSCPYPALFKVQITYNEGAKQNPALLSVHISHCEGARQTSVFKVEWNEKFGNRYVG